MAFFRERRTYLLTAVILVLAFVRRPEGFLGPQLWAEDALVFWSEFNQFGVTSFWTPHAGYLHFIPRGIAAAASLFALEWTGVVFFYSSVAIWCGV